MFRMFLGGSVDATTNEFIAKKGYPRLLSYGYQMDEIAYFCKEKREGRYNGMLMVDSGAFSVYKSGHTVNMDDYIAYINAHPEVDRYVELDFIPGQFGKDRTPEQTKEGAQKSFENYLLMVSKVGCPEKIMPVYHAGETFAHLAKMVSHKYDGEHYVRSICVSGPKAVGNSPVIAKFLTDCFAIIRKTPNPNVEVHALGIGVVEALECQPLFSADFASWVMAAATGTIMTKGFGTISVSDRGNSRSVVNMPKEAKRALDEYARGFGFTLDELVSDYKARWKFNATQVEEIYNGMPHTPKLSGVGLF